MRGAAGAATLVTGQPRRIVMLHRRIVDLVVVQHRGIVVLHQVAAPLHAAPLHEQRTLRQLLLFPAPAFLLKSKRTGISRKKKKHGTSIILLGNKVFLVSNENKKPSVCTGTELFS
jgi:hypothetical protein